MATAPTSPLPRLLARLSSLHPAKVALLGYLSYVLVGWILLCVPLLQAGAGLSALDALFLATSAVSTTGLATATLSGSLNFGGQLVVLLLIQAGGVGYMTFGSCVILSRKPDLPGVRSRVGRTVFSLPSSFRIDRFIRSVVAFTLAIEAAGAAALYAVFRNANTPEPLWNAIFHSVSAFCTAGFSLFDASFEAFAGDFWLNAVIAALSYLGAIGFIVFVDVWRLVQGKVAAITLTSRVILWATLWLALAGTLLLFLAEPALQKLPAEERLLGAFFQASSAMTTVGFNTVPIAALSKASLLLLMVLMVIGASPSGTGGGLKSTTFSALLGVMASAVQGRQEVRFWGRPVPLERIWTALAGLGFYLAALVAGTYLLETTERTQFAENLFEAASALGTVGLSMGITPGLSALGKIVVILLMICGRLGPLTFGIALFFRRERPETAGDGDLAV